MAPRVKPAAKLLPRRMSQYAFVGIVVALHSERRTLRQLHGALVEVSGPGPTNAAAAARRLLARGACCLVSWGTAGGLVPELSAGALLVSAESTDAAAEGLDPPNRSLEATIAATCAALGTVRGRICSVSEPASQRAAKELLNRRTGAIVVDMESASVAAVAREAGMPFAAVRAVVDPLDFEIPAAALLGLRADGRSNVWPVMGSLLRDPVQVMALCRLGLHFRAALRKLEAAATLLARAGFAGIKALQ